MSFTARSIHPRFSRIFSFLLSLVLLTGSSLQAMNAEQGRKLAESAKYLDPAIYGGVEAAAEMSKPQAAPVPMHEAVSAPEDMPPGTPRTQVRTLMKDWMVTPDDTGFGKLPEKGQLAAHALIDTANRLVTEKALRPRMVNGILRDAMRGEEMNRAIEDLPGTMARVQNTQRHLSNPTLGTTIKTKVYDLGRWASDLRQTYRGELMTLTLGATLLASMALVARATGLNKVMARYWENMLNRPKIYTVQSANSIGDDKRRAAGQQLVLSPEVQRNVNEIVETLRWYNGLPRARQREYKLRGVLFYGPPGTGKTSLARALAHRTGWNLIELMADDFNKIKHVADKLVVLEEMFEKARGLGKTMIFLDELEKLVLDRDKGESPLLAKMLELAERGDVFIIGATNRYYDVDSAFRRRLRYHVEVKSPTARMRYKIIENYIEWILREKGFAFEADAMQLAQQLQGKSGAHIESLVERMRDRARLYGNTIVDTNGEERLLVDDHIVREILIDMGIIEPDPTEDDVLDRDAMLKEERSLAID